MDKSQDRTHKLIRVDYMDPNTLEHGCSLYDATLLAMAAARSDLQSVLPNVIIISAKIILLTETKEIQSEEKY